MKVEKDFWIVEVATFWGSDKMVTSDTEIYTSKEEAMKSMKEWLHTDGYAKKPEDEDGTFPGRTFEVKVKEGLYNYGGTVERVTNVPEEYFFRRIGIVHDTIEFDVPLTFDINDIKQIQLIMK